MQMQLRDFLPFSIPVLTATVLMGLLATGSALPAIAHEVKHEKEMEGNLAGQDAATTSRTLGTAMNHQVLGEAPFDAAIRTLLCLEAREAVNKGQLDRQGQQWILINGHRCQDDRLLFDALGF